MSPYPPGWPAVAGHDTAGLDRGLARLRLVILVQDHEARIGVAFVARTRHAPGIAVIVEEEHADRPARYGGQFDAVRIGFHFLIVKADMECAIGRVVLLPLHLSDRGFAEI